MLNLSLVVCRFDCRVRARGQQPDYGGVTSDGIECCVDLRSSLNRIQRSALKADANKQ